MTSLRKPTIPPIRPKVDPITPKEVGAFLTESLQRVEVISGKRPLIARQTFLEHPKKPGDFNEFVELELGDMVTKINLSFVVDMGLYLEVFDCYQSEKPSRVLDECLTNLDEYKSYLGPYLVQTICRHPSV
jgi:hypothetical protein